MAFKVTGYLGFGVSALLFLVSGDLRPDRLSLAQPANTPPVVRILAPENNSVHSVNSLVRYSISASDREDGDSKFDEIPAYRIFLEIRYMHDVNASTGGSTGIRSEPPGLTLVKKSDCFTCHQFNTRLIGPSLAEIAARYSKEKDANKILSGRIRHGSQHIWGEVVMPAHSHLSEEEAQEVADWILEAGVDGDLNFLAGKEGAFRLSIPDGAGRGYFRLKATYTDNGIPDKPGTALTGEDRVIIRVR